MGSFVELLFDPEFVLARFRETWGEFGWRLIHLSTPLLWAIAIPTLAGLIGLAAFVVGSWRGVSFWGAAVERLAGWQWRALGLLTLACLLAYLAIIQFGTSFALSQARYYFPVANAHPPPRSGRRPGAVRGRPDRAQSCHHDGVCPAVYDYRRRTGHQLELG